MVISIATLVYQRVSNTNAFKKGQSYMKVQYSAAELGIHRQANIATTDQGKQCWSYLLITNQIKQNHSQCQTLYEEYPLVN